MDLIQITVIKLWLISIIYWYIIEVMSNQNGQDAILDDSVNNGAAIHQRLKMKFLQQQKERLQLLVFQMSQNLNLLRHINQQLVRGTSHQLNIQINTQNIALEKAYSRLLSQNQQLISEKFISSQIHSEELNEAMEALKNYQQKILTLRRSMQQKQCHVQMLENNSKLTDSSLKNTNVSVPPYNISILFFQEIDDYKQIIKALNKRIQQLTLINNSLQNQLNQTNHSLKWVQNALKSQVSYYQFKQKYNHTNITNSLSNIKLQIHKTQFKKQLEEKKPKHKLTELYQLIPFNKHLSTLLIKKSLQQQLLKKNIKQTREKLLFQSQLAIKLQQSNKIYKNKVSMLTQQLNQIKMNYKVLVNNLYNRKVIKPNKSSQKLEIQQLLKQFKKHQNVIPLSKNQKKMIWVKQKDIFNQKISNSIFKSKKRSLSCLNDYIVANKQHNFEQFQHQKQRQNNTNFSIMLEQFVEKNRDMNDSKSLDPFQFSAIKPVERISYADMRKKKNIKQQQDIKKY